MIDSLKGMDISIENHEISDNYAMRLLVFRKSDNKLVVDRTFIANSEYSLMAKFTAYIAKQRLLRRFTPKKVYIRIKSTTKHKVPLKFFASLEKEYGSKIFNEDD